MSYFITAIVGGIIGWILFPGALHLPFAASALLGLPGGYVAHVVGRSVNDRQAGQPSIQTGLAYAILGTILLMGAADLALRVQ